MDKKILTKTLLTSLSTYDQFLTAFEKNITHRAQFSFVNYFDTYNQTQKICDLIDDYSTLHDIRERINTVLSRASAKDEKILRLYYCDCLSVNQIAKKFNISGRTVFRYLSHALDWFIERIDEVIDCTNAGLLLDNNAWLKNIYRRIAND